MILTGIIRAATVLSTAILLHPTSVSGASCGTYGTLRRPEQIGEFVTPSTSKVELVASCEKHCIDSEKPCLGFSVSLKNKRCKTYTKIMEKQGMARSDSYDELHYDMTCFASRSESESTKVIHDLKNKDDPYTCVPQTEQAVYNPSFESGIWVGFAHGWSLHGNTEENKPRRSAIGNAVDGDTNMVFEVKGNGTSSISQSVCLVPRLKYELTAHIGHVSYQNPFNIWEFYYHAPTVSIYLDRDLIFRNSVCGPDADVVVTQCQPSDGKYYTFSRYIRPRRSTPTLTFEFEFDAPEGKKSYKGLLDAVQILPAEQPI